MQNESVRINQHAGIGRETTQIAIQNNYNGMSPEQASQLAIDLFYKNFPILQEDAKRTAEERAKKFCEEVVKKMVNEGIQDFSPFKEPDVQYSLVNAQNQYARYGTDKMLETLTSLLSKRVVHDKDFVLKVSIDKAVEIAPILTNEQLDYLSLMFLCTRATFSNVSDISQLKILLNMLSDVFKNADFNSVYYLNMLGCLQLWLHDTEKTLSENYKIDKDEIKKICPPIISKTTGDYSTSPIGTVLAIINIEQRTGIKLNPRIWIK